MAVLAQRNCFQKAVQIVFVRPAAAAQLAEDKIVIHIQTVQQPVFLKNHSNMAAAPAGQLLFRIKTDQFILVVIAAAIRPVKAGQDIEQSRLAAAGGAGDGDKTALLNLQTDAVQSHCLLIKSAELTAYLLQTYQFSCHSCSSWAVQIITCRLSRPIPSMTAVFSSAAIRATS